MNNYIGPIYFQEKNKRPVVVQELVDKVFSAVSKVSDWGTNNGQWGFYLMLNLADTRFIDWAILNSKKETVYIVDVGIAKGNWINLAADYIHEMYAHLPKQIHLIGYTGGDECKQEKLRVANLTVSKYIHIKIENIDEICGLHLHENIDLIFVRDTLRHLVDPIGTLHRLYQLLTPQTGMIIFDDFLFSVKGLGLTTLYNFRNSLIPYSSVRAFRATTIKNIECLKSESRSAALDRGEFLFIKGAENDLSFPLHYQSFYSLDVSESECYSLTVVDFKRVAAKKKACEELSHEKLKKLLGIKILVN